jgi:hypothetical protein
MAQPPDQAPGMNDGQGGRENTTNPTLPLMLRALAMQATGPDHSLFGFNLPQQQGQGGQPPYQGYDPNKDTSLGVPIANTPASSNYGAVGAGMPQFQKQTPSAGIGSPGAAMFAPNSSMHQPWASPSQSGGGGIDWLNRVMPQVK